MEARAEVKSEWKKFRADKPGERFQKLHERRNKNASRFSAQRIFNAAAGIAVILVGLILVPAPGPGWLIAVAGFALIATEFLTVARWLDAAEVKVRSWLPGQQKPSDQKAP